MLIKNGFKYLKFRNEKKRYIYIKVKYLSFQKYISFLTFISCSFCEVLCTTINRNPLGAAFVRATL